MPRPGASGHKSERERLVSWMRSLARERTRDRLGAATLGVAIAATPHKSTKKPARLGRPARHRFFVHSRSRSRRRELGCGEEASVRCVPIYGFRQVPCEPGQKFFSRETGVLRQCCRHVRGDGLFKLIRGDRLVWPLADPRLGDLALASLLETVNEFAQSAAHQSSNAAGTEAAKEPAKALRGRLAWTRIARGCAPEHLRDLISVLVPRHCEKTQQRRHRWKSAIHVIAPLPSPIRCAGACLTCVSA